MISVCCCGINCKYDIECLVECLAEHNQDVEFEVCFTHDNRVNDGGSEYYSQLSKKYKWFKVIEHTKQDTIDWLQWMIDIYSSRKIFSEGFRNTLIDNLNKFKTDELFDITKSFLWISSGILYNKAISIASGDYFLVTPADFLYLFKLSDLENYLNQDRKGIGGFTYAKPNAIWARISNSPESWLIENMQNDINKSDHPFNSRCAFAQRDYLRYPSQCSDLNLLDFRHNELINLSDPNFFSKMDRYTRECFQHRNDQQVSPSFHGVHVISKAAYQLIGGFNEIFYGRAFADDHMTKRGSMLAHRHRTSYELPSKFSIGWIGQGEYLPGRFTYNTPEEQCQLLSSREANFNDHPIPGVSGWHYLHHGHESQYVNRLNDILQPLFSEAPIRFTKG